MNNYCTCGTNDSNSKITNKFQYSKNILTSSPIQTTDYEERELNGTTKKVLKTQINVEIIKFQDYLFLPKFLLID